MIRRGWLTLLLLSFALPCWGEGLTIVSSTPHALRVRLENTSPGALYRVTYSDSRHRFTWENLDPDSQGEVVLRDDRQLRPQDRLGCESRTGRGDPVVFDDLTKGAIISRQRQPFGVPVSTFGGPGYLVPGIAEIVQDDFGGFWLAMDHPPYALLRYETDLAYQFAILLPGAPVAFDVDGRGNLYVLHSDNWISKHSPLGKNLGAWQLPYGRDPGQVIRASGLVIDRPSGFIYLADEMLGRVQRFDLDLNYRPVPVTAWGWIGRADLAYTAAGEYDRDQMYYQLDRPRQLRLDGRGNLYVSCEHYLSKFDLGTGKQVPFGRHPVLGWGGSFSDSPFSPAAALDGHWQKYWLAGVDASGNVYVADQENEFVVAPRLQVFAPDGALLQRFDLETKVVAATGEPVYITAAKGLVCSAQGVYLADAAGRIYRAPSLTGKADGGARYLGPGAAGRQFNLQTVEPGKFTVEPQTERVRHHAEGRVLSYPLGQQGTGNCEREASSTVRAGEQSMWLPSRIGEPFAVTLRASDSAVIPPGNYLVEYEENPGLFGTSWDFFRVTNRSGQDWEDVTFTAEAR